MKRCKTSYTFGSLIVLVFFFMTMVPSFVLAADTISLKFAHQNLAPVDTQTMTVKKIIALVDERSGGRINIKDYPGTIADGPELLSVAQEGVTDLMGVVTNFISARVPALAPIEYLGAYPAEGNKFLEVAKSIRPVMTKIFDNEGLTYLACQYSFSGFYNITRKKHLLTTDDYKGLKIRAPGMWMNKQYKAFGASPIMILPPELYSSLQRGVIDGIATIGSLVVGLKLYEPAPFVTETMDASASLVVYTANTKKFSKLSPADQDLIKQAAIDGEKYSIEYGQKIEADMRQLLKDKANYVALSPAQRKAIFDARGDIKEELLEYSGPLGRELMSVFESLK